VGRRVTGQLPCAGGEQRILWLPANLAEGIPTDLTSPTGLTNPGDAVTGLGGTNLDLITAAVLSARGHQAAPHAARKSGTSPRRDDLLHYRDAEVISSSWTSSYTDVVLG
jgi:hypothetical protein